MDQENDVELSMELHYYLVTGYIQIIETRLSKLGEDYLLCAGVIVIDNSNHSMVLWSCFNQALVHLLSRYLSQIQIVHLIIKLHQHRRYQKDTTQIR